MTADAGHDVGEAVADRLRQVAERARPADAHTAARAVALDRRRRRRAGSWAAGALAVVLLGTGASFARSAVTEPAAAPTPAPVTSTYVAPTPPALVEVPTRGSLADDEEFLAAMAETPWTGPAGPDGEVVDWGIPQPEPGTQRVLYAADVPGGDRWAVVAARSGRDWIWAWFIGPRGAEPAEMAVTNGYMPLGPRERLALLGASAETGPLVVLGEPGLEAEYSPSLDRAPTGELVRDFTALPVVDGVPLGVVDTPVTWNAGEVRVAIGAAQQPVYPVFGGQPASWPAYPTGPIDEALAAPCLEGLGLDVETEPGLSWGESAPPPMSSAEEAAREHEIAACMRAAEP